MGFTAAIFMATGVGIIACAPTCLACSWLAKRLHSPSGSDLAKSAAALCWWLPFLIGVGGIFLMCLFTGVQLGS